MRGAACCTSDLEGRVLRSLASFDDLRQREFARLGEHVYLDYTGSALYADSQLRAHHALLESGLFGNPHSDSAPSRATSDVIANARRRVLHFRSGGTGAKVTRLLRRPSAA